MSQSITQPKSDKISQFEQKLNKHNLAVLDETLRRIKKKLTTTNFKYEQLASLFYLDPMSLFNFLSCANQYALQHSAEFEENIKTPHHASMLLGIDNIRGCISKLHPLSQIKNKAIEGKIEQIACRSLHCAYQARHLAKLMRVKTKEAEEDVFLSALMMSLAELLVWFISPRQAQKYELLITNNTSITTEVDAQLAVFGFTFSELILRLAPQWNLPKLYIKAIQTDIFDEAQKSIICIKLADKLSRLVDFGWYYQDIYDHLDYCALVTPFSTQRLSKEFHFVAASMADVIGGLYQLSLPTSSLLLTLEKIPYYQVISLENTSTTLEKQTKKYPKIKKIIPKTVDKLESATNLPLLIQLTINTLFESKSFDQVIMLMLDKSKTDVTVRLEKTYLHEPTLHKKINIFPDKNLFSLLIQKHQPIYINTTEEEKQSKLLNPAILNILPSLEFFAKGFYYKNKPIGIFYATHSNHLDNESYVFFKKILQRFELHLNRLS